MNFEGLFGKSQSPHLQNAYRRIPESAGVPARDRFLLFSLPIILFNCKGKKGLSHLVIVTHGTTDEDR